MNSYRIYVKLAPISPKELIVHNDFDQQNHCRHFLGCFDILEHFSVVCNCGAHSQGLKQDYQYSSLWNVNRSKTNDKGCGDDIPKLGKQGNFICRIACNIHNMGSLLWD